MALIRRAVLFDSLKAAKARNADVLIVDTRRPFAQQGTLDG